MEDRKLAVNGIASYKKNGKREGETRGLLLMSRIFSSIRNIDWRNDFFYYSVVVGCLLT